MAVVGGYLGVAKLIGGDEDKQNVTAEKSSSPSPSASPSASQKPCEYTKQGSPAKPVALPKFDAKKAAEPYTATIKTNLGDITVDMLSGAAPCASYSFRHLAEKNFFDATPCPRVVSEATFGVLQCGDPTGTASGGPGYVFPNENLTGERSTPPAPWRWPTAGPTDSNGSQFFIVYKDTKLPPNYTPFGKVIKGLDVVQKVGKAGDDGSNQAGGGKPKLPITIADVVIAKK